MAYLYIIASDGDGIDAAGGNINVTAGNRSGAGIETAGYINLKLATDGTTGAPYESKLKLIDSSSNTYLDIDPGRTGVSPSVKTSLGGIMALKTARPQRSYDISISSFWNATSGSASPSFAGTPGSPTTQGLDQYRYFSLPNATDTHLAALFNIPDEYDDTSGTTPDLIIEIVYKLIGAVGVGEYVGIRYSLLSFADNENFAVSGGSPTWTNDNKDLTGYSDGKIVKQRITIPAPDIDASDLVRFFVRRDGPTDSYSGDCYFLGAKLILFLDRL